jgi:hypothetical protein
VPLTECVKYKVNCVPGTSVQDSDGLMENWFLVSFFHFAIRNSSFATGTTINVLIKSRFVGIRHSTH